MCSLHLSQHKRIKKQNHKHEKPRESCVSNDDRERTHIIMLRKLQSRQSSIMILETQNLFRTHSHTRSPYIKRTKLYSTWALMGSSCKRRAKCNLSCVAWIIMGQICADPQRSIRVKMNVYSRRQYSCISRTLIQMVLPLSRNGKLKDDCACFINLYLS